MQKNTFFNFEFIKIAVFSVLAAFSFTCFSQTLYPVKTIKINPEIKSVILENKYKVDISSMKLFTLQNNNFVKFSFDPLSGILSIDTANTDTLILKYKLFPIVFTGKFYHRSTSIIEKKPPSDPFANNYKYYSEINDGSLKTNGNISRGISAGNRQDMVVNSNLNLKLNGKIAGDINISGIISDDNNPIQPEGNTQQLQDFDKVFIQLNKDSNNFIIGDFEMHSPKSYFMNYNKKSRGLHFDFIKKTKSIEIRNDADLAISRGRFSRNTFQGIEGNQGPYRLKGSNGEIFIIIISGTEAIYIDGKKLNRGESNDYVINYNTGELTFMPSIMITKFSRIVAEFQYSDRNYQRSVIKTGIEIKKENTQLRVNYYVEQDNKNQNFQQSLDGFDSSKNLSAKQILSLTGDNTQNAFIPHIKKVIPFDNTKLLYRKIDSLGFKDVYVFTQYGGLDSVFYDVTFSNVGEGNGNYRLKNTTANGRVYEWILPINGVKQGNYEPVEMLIAPQRYQMITLGFNKKYKNTKSFFECVYSNIDKNTFSELDKSNDDGYGIFTGFENTFLFPKNNDIKLINNFKTEIVSKNFKYVERYRNVEFERLWNRKLNIPEYYTNITNSEIISNYNFLLSIKDKLKFDYNVGLYYMAKDKNGLNNKFSFLYSFDKNHFQSFAEFMKNSINTANESYQNKLNNYGVEYIRKFKPGNLGITANNEQSIFSKNNDSIVEGSFRYYSAKVFFENLLSEKFNYSLSNEKRFDYLPRAGVLKPVSKSDEIKFKMQFQNKSGKRISLSLNQRNLNISDTLLSKQKNESNTLGRLETTFDIFKKMFKISAFYQIGTVQEQKREYMYYKVADGNGIYIWNDYDSNKIQSLNEFEIASELDRKRANYIKTYLPVDGFIKSKNIQYNQSVNFAFPQKWSNAEGIKHLFSKISASSSIRTDRKTMSDKTQYFLYPFGNYNRDTLLLSNNTFSRSTLYINRNNNKWSIDINNTQSNSKNLLVNGYETLKNNDYSLNSRFNINRKFACVMKLVKGEKSYFSQLLTLRNYTYNHSSIEPQLQYTSTQNNAGISIIGKYYHAKSDTIYCRNIETGTEIRISKAMKGMFSGNFRYIIIDFNGDNSSPLGYELMKGLLAGKNFTWNMIYQQRISQNIQIEIVYDGRKSENSPYIHIGRVLARYLF
ncbi:MAG: hypothetical protein HUU47_02800 [Bacteroidetes bacterium]|nr:hypothetical protein [Bacteroidota bacterium]